MLVKIDEYDPIHLPKPYSRVHHLLTRMAFKQLGISPTVDNGIRAWRVIWRPRLKVPVPYTRIDGRPGLREKSHRVCTKRFPIVGDVTEEQAYRQALRLSSLVYGGKLPSIMPLVNWKQLAAAKGVKLRESYSKPALNGAIDQACELFEQGWGLRDVADRLGVSKSTACRWRQTLKKQKALP